MRPFAHQCANANAHTHLRRHLYCRCVSYLSAGIGFSGSGRPPTVAFTSRCFLTLTLSKTLIIRDLSDYPVPPAYSVVFGNFLHGIRLRGGFIQVIDLTAPGKALPRCHSGIQPLWFTYMLASPALLDRRRNFIEPS